MDKTCKNCKWWSDQNSDHLIMIDPDNGNLGSCYMIPNYKRDLKFDTKKGVTRVKIKRTDHPTYVPENFGCIAFQKSEKLKTKKL